MFSHYKGGSGRTFEILFALLDFWFEMIRLLLIDLHMFKVYRRVYLKRVL